MLITTRDSRALLGEALGDAEDATKSSGGEEKFPAESCCTRTRKAGVHRATRNLWTVSEKGDALPVDKTLGSPITL